MSQEESPKNSLKPPMGLLKLIERSPLDQSTTVLPPEQFETLEQWNVTQADHPDLECFDSLFRKQVAKTPQAIAVVEENESLTYQELDARVERVARHLQGKGVEPEKPVAVVAERGWKLLTMVLAIFRTGSVYVPLDPQVPVARLCQLLKHSGSSTLLTPAEGVALIQQAFVKQMFEQPPTILCLDELLAEEIVRQPESPEAGDLNAGQAAYVLYTSGAKGEPRGIVVEQQGLLRWIYALLDELQLTESDSVAQVAPVGSHLSIWQMLAPLLAGAQITVFADSVVQNPLSLIQRAGEKQITMLQMFPSTLRVLLKKLERIEAFVPELTDLRFLHLTGEVLSG